MTISLVMTVAENASTVITNAAPSATRRVMHICGKRSVSRPLIACCGSPLVYGALSACKACSGYSHDAIPALESDIDQMNNGTAERKWPNQPPEHAREITTRKAGTRIYASLCSAVMALPVSGGRLASFGSTGSAVSPTLNVVHAGPTTIVRLGQTIDRPAY